MKEVMIKVDNVTFSYDEEQATPAVQNVTLEVRKGEFLAVLGQNGSGKSTLAKLMNGLYQPTEGTITVCNMDTKDEKNTWAIRKNAGMVFQNPDNQLVATLVLEDVAFGLENIGVPTEDMMGRIEEALQNVGMLEFKDRAPHLLSGGQKQRVAIAGILAMRPQIIIFDEATAMLDPQGRKEVFEAVKKLNKEHEITVVWITHFMEEAAKCDYIEVMHNGSLVTSGKPKDIFKDIDFMRSMRLDVPQMTHLAHLLNKENYPLDVSTLTVEEMVEEVKKHAAHI